MKQVGLALIGAGSVAQTFHLPIIQKLSNVKLLAICDKNKSKANFIAQKFDVPYVSDNLNDLLKIDSIEAVDICTSTDSHYEISSACLDSGRHIIIEKPVARNYEETKRIYNASLKTDKKVMVGMNLRFRSDSIMLKNFINMKEIGNVFYIKSGWLHQKRETHWLEQIDKSGGGVLIDLGISMLDLLMWFYQFAPIHSVQVSVFYNLTKTVEDVCIAMIKFKNNSIATLETSWTLFSRWHTLYCNVYGDEGSAYINPLQLFKSKAGFITPVHIPEGENTLAIQKKSFESEIKHFVNAILGLGPIHSTLDEAVQVMKVIEAMYISAKEGREIVLD